MTATEIPLCSTTTELLHASVLSVLCPLSPVSSLSAPGMGVVIMVAMLTAASLLLHSSSVFSKSPDLKSTVLSAALVVAGVLVGFGDLSSSRNGCLRHADLFTPSGLWCGDGLKDLPLFPLLSLRDYLPALDTYNSAHPGLAASVQAMFASAPVHSQPVPVILAIALGFLILLRHPHILLLAASVLLGGVFAVFPTLATAPWFWGRLASAVWVLLFAVHLYPAAAATSLIVWAAQASGMYDGLRELIAAHADVSTLAANIPTMLAAVVVIATTAVFLHRYAEAFFWLLNAGPAAGLEQQAQASAVFIIVRAFTGLPVTHPAWLLLWSGLRASRLAAPPQPPPGPPPSPIAISPATDKGVSTDYSSFTYPKTRVPSNAFEQAFDTVQAIGSLFTHVWVAMMCLQFVRTSGPAMSGTPQTLSVNTLLHDILAFLAPTIPGLSVTQRLTDSIRTGLEVGVGLSLSLLGVCLVWRRARNGGGEGWRSGLPVRRLVRWLVLTAGLSVAQSVGSSSASVDMGWMTACGITAAVLFGSSPAPGLRWDTSDHLVNPHGPGAPSVVDAVMDTLPVVLALSAQWRPTMTPAMPLKEFSVVALLPPIASFTCIWLVSFLLGQFPTTLQWLCMETIHLMHVWFGAYLLSVVTSGFVVRLVGPLMPSPFISACVYVAFHVWARLVWFLLFDDGSDNPKPAKPTKDHHSIEDIRRAQKQLVDRLRDSVDDVGGGVDVGGFVDDLGEADDGYVEDFVNADDGGFGDGGGDGGFGVGHGGDPLMEDVNDNYPLEPLQDPFAAMQQAERAQQNIRRRMVTPDSGPSDSYPTGHQSHQHQHQHQPQHRYQPPHAGHQPPHAGHHHQPPHAGHHPHPLHDHAVVTYPPPASDAPRGFATHPPPTYSQPQMQAPHPQPHSQHAPLPPHQHQQPHHPPAPRPPAPHFSSAAAPQSVPQYAFDGASGSFPVLRPASQSQPVPSQGPRPGDYYRRPAAPKRTRDEATDTGGGGRYSSPYARGGGAGAGAGTGGDRLPGRDGSLPIGGWEIEKLTEEVQQDVSRPTRRIRTE